MKKVPRDDDRPRNTWRYDQAIDYDSLWRPSIHQVVQLSASYMFIRRLYNTSYSPRLSQSSLSLSAKTMSNPLKRPAPATRDSSSSSIQVISPQKPRPKADVPLDDKDNDKDEDGTKPADSAATLSSPTIPTSSTAQVKKPEDKVAEPPTKKPKIALVPGGAGSGGQTKLAFGKVGEGKSTTSSGAGAGAGAGKKAVAGTGSSSGTGGSGGRVEGLLFRNL